MICLPLAQFAINSRTKSTTATLASINERERPQTASIGESEMMSKITAS